MKLSLCITTYNRFEMTIDCISRVIDDQRINDIVILDDCSTDGSAERLVEHYNSVDKSGKVYIGKQQENVGMSKNKAAAIAAAQCEWVIILDSDNVIGKDYIDAFYSFAVGEGLALDAFSRIAGIEKFIFCPDFAMPKFDYRKFACGNKGREYRSGIYGAKECAQEAKDDSFNCLLNTCNYIVNRDFYLQTYQHNPEHIASDTIWHNYNHLKNGGFFVVVPGMQYMHRVHARSGFMQNAEYNMKQAAKVRALIQQL